MATFCAFQRSTKTKTIVAPTPVTDRELELAAIIAAAELAFDQMSRGRQNIAA